MLFVLEDICYYNEEFRLETMPEADRTLNKMLNSNNNLIILTSDLGFGQNESNGTTHFSRTQLVDFLQGKLSNNTQMSSLIKRINKVIIAGNLITCPSNVDTIIKNNFINNNTNIKAYKEISESYDEADEYLKYLSATVEIDLMPGSDDMSDNSYPKKPINEFFLPKSAKDQTIRFVSCPYKFRLGNKIYLATSGTLSIQMFNLFYYNR